MRKIVLRLLILFKKLTYPTKNERIIRRAIKYAIRADELNVVYDTAKHQQSLQKATIEAETISDLKFLLRELSKIKGFDFLTDSEITSILNHENAHSNVAEIVGAPPTGYEVVIVKEGKNFYVAPFASFDDADDWLSEKKKVLDMIRILNAPNEYGDTNSVSDNKSIEKMKKLLLTIHE